MDLITAPKCKSLDNKHIVEDCPSPYAVKCIICGERFVLVAESILEKLGIGVTPRQTLRS